MAMDDRSVPRDEGGARQKLFAGGRLKRLRRTLGLTQGRMAEELGVSVSYLNLIEGNQRPLTARLVLKLAEVYDIDVRTLASEQDEGAAAELAEAFADPILREHAPSRHELRELVETHPTAATAIGLLYRAYRQVMTRATEGGGDPDHGAGGGVGPNERLRDYMQSMRNYFPTLDERGETLAEELDLPRADAFAVLSDRLLSRHGYRVRVLPCEVLGDTLRRIDRHRRELHLSELLDPAGRAFQAGYFLGLLEANDDIGRLVKEAKFEGAEAQLARVMLANYFSGAVLLPYGTFLSAAESLGYDLEVLACRFGASIEQIAHRLTNLQRPTERGVPFFFLRVDRAGNVSKRFSAGKFHFSAFGGTCPLWNVHEAFQRPARILSQIVETPDGARYFTIARTVPKAAARHGTPKAYHAIALGCDLKYAERLVYAKGFDLKAPDPTLIGVNCALCERPSCPARAAPPLGRPLVVDERVRGLSPFLFEL